LISAYSTTTFSSPPAGVGSKSPTRDPVQIGESTLYKCEEGKDQVVGDHISLTLATPNNVLYRFKTRVSWV